MFLLPSSENAVEDAVAVAVDVQLPFSKYCDTDLTECADLRNCL